MRIFHECIDGKWREAVYRVRWHAPSRQATRKRKAFSVRITFLHYLNNF